MDSREPIEDHELAACPFCGAPAVLIMEGRRAPVYSARCDNAKCAVMPEIDSRSKAKVIAAWNRRPSPVAESTPTDATAVEAEREACARVADAWTATDPVSGQHAHMLAAGMREAAREIAAAIRSRATKES